MSRPSRQKSWQTGRERVSVLAALAIQKETVSRKLARLRAANADPQTGKPLSQEKAAARVHVTMRQWQRWEGGESIPYPRNLEAIAEEFGFDVAEFFDDEDEQPATPDPFSGNSQPSELSERLERLEGQLAEVLSLLRPPAEGEEPARPPGPPPAFDVPTVDTSEREQRNRRSTDSERRGA